MTDLSRIARSTDPLPAPAAAEGWRDRAACADSDLDFFAVAVGNSRQARREIRKCKAVCARCGVRQPCLDYAITYQLDQGIWGGLTETERVPLYHGVRESTSSSSQASTLVRRQRASGRARSEPNVSEEWG